MAVEVAVQFFLEHMWVPFCGAIAFLVRSLMNKNREFTMFKADTERRLSLVEAQMVTTETMRKIIQEVLAPHTETMRGMDEKLDEMNDQITDIRIHVGK